MNEVIFTIARPVLTKLGSLWAHFIFFFSLSLSLSPAAVPPTFDNVATDGSTTANIAENAAVGDVIMTLSATDGDSNPLTYSLVTVSTDFEVVVQQLKVKAGASLDYETTQTYTLTVR